MVEKVKKEREEDKVEKGKIKILKKIFLKKKKAKFFCF